MSRKKPSQKASRPQELSDEERLDYLKTQVVNEVKRVNLILSGGTLLALTIVILKIFHVKDFTWNGITIPITGSGIIFLLLTLFHYHQGCLVVINSAHDLWKASRSLPKYAQSAYHEIQSDAGIFIRRLEPRTSRINVFILEKFPINIYKMDDVPGFVSYCSAIILFLAIVPWDFSSLKSLVYFAAFAFFLIFFNWTIGTAWIVAISEFLDDSDSLFHREIEQTRKSHTSRFMAVLDLGLLGTRHGSGMDCSCGLGCALFIIIAVIATIVVSVFPIH
jgi:hypothetical protein